MILLNFSQPLTDEQIRQVEKIASQPIERIDELHLQFDPDESFIPQLKRMIDRITLSTVELKTKAIVVNLPPTSTVAALVLAELHGRMGHFPPILRLRLRSGCTPLRYEVGEIFNLQAAHDAAERRENEEESGVAEPKK